MARSNRQANIDDNTPNEDRKYPQIVPDEEDLQAFYDWYQKNEDLNSYSDVRRDLQWIKFGVRHGLIDTKVANTQVYIASHILIALDKARLYEVSGNKANKFFEQHPVIPLTTEQMMLVGQEPRMAVQIQLLQRFADENARGVDVSERVNVGHRDPVIDAQFREMDEANEEKDWVF